MSKKHLAASREWLVTAITAKIAPYLYALNQATMQDDYARRYRIEVAALVDDLMLLASESDETGVDTSTTPFGRDAHDAEAAAWANADCHDWETIIGGHDHDDVDVVRRLSVPGGWLYQVAGGNPVFVAEVAR